MVYGVWSVVAYHVPALLALFRVVEQLLKSRPVDIPHLWFRAQGSALVCVWIRHRAVEQLLESLPRLHLQRHCLLGPAP